LRRDSRKIKPLSGHLNGFTPSTVTEERNEAIETASESPSESAAASYPTSIEESLMVDALNSW